MFGFAGFKIFVILAASANWRANPFLQLVKLHESKYHARLRKFCLVLVAKVQALLRRSYDFAGSAPVLEHRGIVLNTGDNSLTCNGQKLDLSRNEYRILLTLMQNKGKIVSREKLMEALWQTDSFVDENTLTVNVGRLRKKLEAAGVSDFITTKFGEGYLVEQE